MKSSTGTDEATVRTLLPGEARQVGEVIADSHADYPSFTHLFPNSEQRLRVLTRLMTGAARDAAAFGEVHVAVKGTRMLGVAVWLPPGTFPWSPRRKIKATATFLPLLWQTRPSTAEFFALGTNAERAAPAEPHWNLQVLGIRREAQGRALGHRLLEPVLTRADRDRVPCYLETAEPANLDYYQRFYQRFGFKFERRHQHIPNGPSHYSMRRPPQQPHIAEGRP